MSSIFFLKLRLYEISSHIGYIKVIDFNPKDSSPQTRGVSILIEDSIIQFSSEVDYSITIMFYLCWSKRSTF